MDIIKKIGLVAHDNMKANLIEWVEYNWEKLKHHKLICTGTTGKLVEAALLSKMEISNGDMHSLNMVKLKSGPLGGDQQLGSLISEGNIDVCNPLTPYFLANSG